MPFTFYNFSGALPPYYVDGANWDTYYQIASNFKPVDGEKSADVTETLTVFTWGVIGCAIGSFVLVYLMSVVFRAGIYFKKFKQRLRKDSVIWELVTILLCNDNIACYTTYSMRVLMTSLIVGMFYVVQYYGGYFNTDLVVVAKPFKIDNLDDLVISNKVPIWFMLDPTMYDYEHGRTAAHLRVWQRHLENKKLRDGDPNKVVNQYQTVDAEVFGRICNYLSDHKAALITVRQLASFQKMVYCISEPYGEDRDFTPTAHLSKPLDETVFGSLFHPNASWEVRSRYHYQLIRMFEGKLIHKALYEKADEVALDMVLGGKSIGEKVAKCMRGNEREQTPDDLVVVIGNITRLIFYCFCVTMFGLLVLVLEVDVNLTLKRRKRRSRVKKLFLRRIRQQRVVSILTGNNAAYWDRSQLKSNLLS